MKPSADRQKLTSAQADKNSHERELLRHIALRDRPAFEELYCDYHRRLTRFLTRVTRRHELADEVINDTFWVVWQKAGEFRGTSLVSTWIMGIAYRCALKALRRSGAGGSTESLSLDDADHHAFVEPFVAEEQKDWVEHGLRLLPEDQRTTLQLTYYLGHSCEEIAEIMECPVSTVKARMFRARVKLRNLLPALGGWRDGENHESIG
ncbi:MAG: RNA polymerase sigma factor [Stenotrophobium sp.]